MQNPTIQQVVEALRGANNVLITVKNSPSVDELTASIALTLILNHMNKHATTVFSGKVPSTIEFLQPEMAIESNTDSLRDFIIALDKSKADKLRYKVEDNVVRIFITPYKSSISEADLEFSQGDFNVDLVVALGVLSRDDFDQAVMAHGRILHDATVVAITNQELQQEVGMINWQEPQASSVSEMITQIVDLFGMKVMDSQIATALLTGIVAETDRFKNEKTTPQVLSVSSMLMTEGANQVLIAEELEQPPQTESQYQPLGSQSDDSNDQNGGNNDGTLSVQHDEQDSVGNINIDEQGNINAFGAVGEQSSPQDMLSMNPDEDMPAGEHEVLPDVSAPSMMPLEPAAQDQPPQDGAQDHEIVSDRPYLEPPQPEHHQEDENLSEPSGLFGSSMHDVGSSSAASTEAMFGHTPKVLQPLSEQEAQTHDAGSIPFESAHEPAESAHEPMADFGFGTSGHTQDMPGEYQAVASDPIAPYTPPADAHEEMPASPAPALHEQPTVDLPHVVEAPSSSETLEDIERKVGSVHVAESAGLPHVQAPAPNEGVVDDFIGSVRTPQPSSDAPHDMPPEAPHTDVAIPPIAPVVAPLEQVVAPPEPTVVQPYQPPAPLHEENAVDPSSPPQVPPPLTMPKATSNQPVFYDPDGTKNNPFNAQ